MNASELVKNWLVGRADLTAEGRLQFRERPASGLAEKFRRAYRWIADQSLLPGTLDFEWDVRRRLGRDGRKVSLPEKESLSSFILLPLLTLMTSRRMVFVGAPGHGKTSMATIMALLLQKNGRSGILGAVGRLPEYVEAFQAPEIKAHANDISINARVVSTPLISSVRQTLCVAAGFVAVTAEDSQRVWLLEAA